MRDTLLAASINIGEEIIRDAIRTPNGWYWTNLEYDGSENVSANLYNGNSGVAYYLIELYEASRDSRFLDAAKESAAWLEEYDFEAKKENSLNFYCGSGGVILVMIRLWRISGENRYRERAIALLSSFAESNSSSKCDLLTGYAGDILTLLYAYKELGGDWLINRIHIAVESILSNAVYSKDGLGWDRLGHSVSPLCGLSHGSSGVAFVFLELYKFTQIDFFKEIARHAFNYEDSFFTNGNWPDLRQDLVSEEGIEKAMSKYQNGDSLSDVSDCMCAWCHGAPGIAMVRLYAVNDFDEPEKLSILEMAVQTTRESLDYEYRNYTLCHGKLGNASLLIDYSVVNSDKRARDIAIKFAKECLNDRNYRGYWLSGFNRINNKADKSLFLGQSGIGWYFLRLLSPKIMNVLLPVIDNKHQNFALPGFDNAYRDKFYLRLLFPNIFGAGIHVNTLCDQNKNISVVKEEISGRLSDVISALGGDEVLERKLDLDAEIFDMICKKPSDAYLSLEKLVHEERLKQHLQFINGDVWASNQEFQLHQKVKLCDLKHYASTMYILLQYTHSGQIVQQYELSKFAYDFLKLFCNPVRMSYVFQVFNFSSIGNYSIETRKQMIANLFFRSIELNFISFIK